MAKKVRRNISIDRELDEWLESDVENASELVSELLLAYKAYGGEKIEAARYTCGRRTPQED